MQLTTDGHKGYLSAVEGAFGIDVDYAMLVKLYGGNQGDKIRVGAPIQPRQMPRRAPGRGYGHNFARIPRIHKSLCVTPAMQAGVGDHVWTLDERIMVGRRETIYILSPMRPIPRREETCGNRGPQL